MKLDLIDSRGGFCSPRDDVRYQVQRNLWIDASSGNGNRARRRAQEIAWSRPPEDWSGWYCLRYACAPADSWFGWYTRQGPAFLP